MKHVRSLMAIAGLVTAIGSPLSAQVSITPLVGGYIPASDINQVQGSASNIAKTREGTLALGANLDFGLLRIGAAYASGTTIKNASKQDIGKGDVLAGAVDLVIRPIPRIIVVQPYLIAGAGGKFYKYNESSSLVSGGDKQTFALHGGIGADLMVGPIGVVAELSDYVSKGFDDKWNVHDAFLMVGLKLRFGQ